MRIRPRLQHLLFVLFVVLLSLSSSWAKKSTDEPTMSPTDSPTNVEDEKTESPSIAAITEAPTLNSELSETVVVDSSDVSVGGTKRHHPNFHTAAKVSTSIVCLIGPVFNIRSLPYFSIPPLLLFLFLLLLCLYHQPTNQSTNLSIKQSINNLTSPPFLTSSFIYIFVYAVFCIYSASISSYDGCVLWY